MFDRGSRRFLLHTRISIISSMCPKSCEVPTLGLSQDRQRLVSLHHSGFREPHAEL